MTEPQPGMLGDGCNGCQKTMIELVQQFNVQLNQINLWLDLA